MGVAGSETTGVSVWQEQKLAAGSRQAVYRALRSYTIKSVFLIQTLIKFGVGGNRRTLLRPTKIRE